MDNAAGYIYHLNSELLESERIFKLSSARINRDNSLVITLLVRAADYDKLLTDGLREKVETLTRKLVPEPYHPAVVYKKTISDESYVVQCVNDFLYSESPLVFRKLSDCEITAESGYDTIKVRLSLPPYIYSFMETNGYGEKLADYLETQLIEHIEVEFLVDNKPRESLSFVKRKAQTPQTVGQKVIEVSELVSIVSAVSRMPKYISEALKGESDNQTICGKVSSFASKVSKNTGKPFFTMKLDDTTGQMEAVYFARDEKAAESFAKEIKDGITVCAEGPVRLSQYNGTFSLQIRRISRCKINYGSIKNDIQYLEEDEDYYTIRPQPYIEEQQAILFEEAKPLPDALKGDFVVFDFETTGLIPTSDKIIEIGAVKMCDGVLTETFSTLINPGCHIPESASQTNNIFDADVANAPSLGQVIGDFYKFTRGSTLVGHNSEAFDNNFLSYWGKQHRYNFDNPTADTLKIAKEKLPDGSKVGLGLLCKKFDIPLENAHRAVYDAIATAKLFRKLCEL